MKSQTSEAEKLDDLTPNPTETLTSFPPDTAKYMSWSAIKFINSPTSHMLDLTCAIIIGALIMCFILGKALFLDVSVLGPAEITVQGGVRDVVSPIDGLVTKVYKKNGEAVKEDELIARLQIDEEASAEIDDLSHTINQLLKTVEETGSPEDLNVGIPRLVKSSKIYDPVLLQAVANIEHAIHDFQLQRQQALALNSKIPDSEAKLAKNSDIFYSVKRIEFLNSRLNKMKASKNRDLLASYIDSTEEELGRLKNQVTSSRLKARATLDQAYAELLRSLRIATGSLNDFKQHHEIRAPISGVIGRIIEGDNYHVTVNRSIAMILPNNSKFIARIKMKSKDIVRLKKGQKVFFKVEAYPFQRYGLFTGEVIDFDQLKEVQGMGPQSATDDTYYLNATIFPPEKPNEDIKKQIKFIFGMQAEATVVMERKSINSIIMDKFFNLKEL